MSLTCLTALVPAGSARECLLRGVEEGVVLDLGRELDVCLRSRFSLICVVSREEERVSHEILELCKTTNRVLYQWDLSDHLRLLHGLAALPTASDPISALDAIDQTLPDGVILLPDFHLCLQNQPRVIRKLRSVTQRLKYTRKNIIITSPTAEMPPELKDECVTLEVPSPGAAELARILDDLLRNPHARIRLSEDDRERLLRAALGLSSNQAQRAFARAIVSDGVLDARDIQLIQDEKKTIIRESGALEFYAAAETTADVGGLEVLKTWLRMREKAFSKEAQAYGLPAPKGIALMGIPGTGKSLSAKMIAATWRLPLVRMDIGALFGSLIGQSEENARRALCLAETVAPCVLWIDEIEKGLSMDQGDSGTTMRVFASILSWMQERRKPVFVVATANNVSALPPELLRRGRFDEIFFLDLPTRAERRAIFQVHLRKRGRNADAFDLDRLSAASEGYVGAEIEQAIVDAMFAAFSDVRQPGREFTHQDIAVALRRLVPMSRSQRETIGDLRRWLTEGRAQSASFSEVRQARDQFVQVPHDPMGPESN
jgi:SpoVK/Ycf46/Vps4 family AAA+-type ATPase